jgi:hypothetical protein
MTAALLNHFLPPGKCRITLVESADVGIIGVGEATVPPLVRYLRSLGINEDEFMVATHASYKLGIKFINWRNGNDTLSEQEEYLRIERKLAFERTAPETPFRPLPWTLRRCAGMRRIWQPDAGKSDGEFHRRRHRRSVSNRRDR